MIGEYPQRRSSPNRSELLAHVEDIINAIYQLDEENITFRFSAFNLSRIPIGNPNESDYMAVAEKMHKMESRLQNLESVSSENKANILQNRDLITELDTKLSNKSSNNYQVPKPNFADVVSGRPLHNITSRPIQTLVTESGASDSSHIRMIPMVEKTDQIGPNFKEKPVTSMVSNHASKLAVETEVDESTRSNKDPADGFQIPKEHKKRQDREKRRREIIKGTATHGKLKGGPMSNRDYFV